MVPWDQDLLSLEYDGLFLSNGPGDPALAQTLIQNVRKVGSVAVQTREASEACDSYPNEKRSDKKKKWHK